MSSARRVVGAGGAGTVRPAVMSLAIASLIVGGALVLLAAVLLVPIVVLLRRRTRRVDESTSS